MAGEWMRWANVVLSGAALAVLVATMTARWDTLTARIKRIGVSSCTVLLVIAYGSGEAASQHVPAGLRVGMMLVALSALVGSLLWHFNEDD
jgi:hypothetical protein